MAKKSISIVGFGRFGKTLFKLLSDDFNITIYDKSTSASEAFKHQKNANIASSLNEIFFNKDIFYAVPISDFEKVITSHKKYFTEKHLIIDVLSVKLYPKNILDRQLNNSKTQALLTHPMFGPDSSKKGFEGLTIVIDKYKTNKVRYNFWKKYLASKGLNIVEMTADKHDRLAASSQGLSHFIGRALKDMRYKPTIIDTASARKLNEIKSLTTNDSIQLFIDLQNFNPYCQETRRIFINSLIKINKDLEQK